MAKQLSGAELYALVWSEPMKTLSGRFGISDVALKKTCARAKIPTPDRAYWVKKEGGKSPMQESDARVRCKRHFPSVCPVWRKELWALSEADRINPAIGGAFLIAMRDEDDAQDVRLPSGE